MYSKITANKNEKNHFSMIEKVVKYKNELVLFLNSEGEKWIFSDYKDLDDGYITKNVPFVNHNHYLYIDEDLDSAYPFIGFAWYSNTESYVNQFKTLEECLNWLVDAE